MLTCLVFLLVKWYQNPLQPRPCSFSRGLPLFLVSCLVAVAISLAFFGFAFFRHVGRQDFLNFTVSAACNVPLISLIVLTPQRSVSGS